MQPRDHERGDHDAARAFPHAVVELRTGARRLHGIALPMAADSRHQELFFFAGARVKARAYNAFLQGQFRGSEVRYGFSQIEPVVAEAWLGMVMPLLEQTELSYMLRYQTAELRSGRAARDALWGTVQLAHAF